MSQAPALGVYSKNLENLISSIEEPHCPALTAGLSALSLSLSLSFFRRRQWRASRDALVYDADEAWRQKAGAGYSLARLSNLGWGSLFSISLEGAVEKKACEVAAAQVYLEPKWLR